MMMCQWRCIAETVMDNLYEAMKNDQSLFGFGRKCVEWTGVDVMVPIRHTLKYIQFF